MPYQITKIRVTRLKRSGYRQEERHDYPTADSFSFPDGAVKIGNSYCIHSDDEEKEVYETWHVVEV